MSTVAGVWLVLAQVCASQQAKLTSSDGLTFDSFGASVDLFQDRIVVGAPSNRPVAIGTQTGSAYVFELAGGVWQEQAQLTPSFQVPKGYFGLAVACDADRVAVGAPLTTPTAVPGARGLAYVYAKSGAAWVEEALLDAADPAVTIFGSAVDIDGDTLLVGASGGSQGGAAFVYLRSGGAWALQAKLLASDAAVGAEFGTALALRGDTAVVGAYRAKGAQESSGAAYVFQRSGNTWIETQKLFPANGASADSFGLAVALDGATLVVGAPFVDAPQPSAWKNHGSAYVFEWNGQQWLETQQITPVGYGAEEHFGFGAAVHGGALALGAPDEAASPGFAHLALSSGAGWLQHFKLTSLDGFAGLATGSPSRFAADLALEGTRLVAGAPTAEGGIYPTAGAVYVFDLPPQVAQPTYYCSAKQDSRGCVPRLFHDGLPSISGAQSGQAYRLRVLDLQAQVPSMIFYSTVGAASAPFAGGFLCTQQPAHPTQMAITAPSSAAPPCGGQLTYDFNAWIASGLDPALTAGQSVWLQCWYRDPLGVPGVNIGLSAGIHGVICP